MARSRKPFGAGRSPGAATSCVTYKESGLLSAEHLYYLRVMRKMFAFDICAAPSGAGSSS